MTRGARLFVGALVGLVLLLGAGVLTLILLFPPAKVRALVMVEATRASGYALSLGDARLGWSGGGVVIHLKEIVARSPDGAHEIKAPTVDLLVDVWPLLRRVVLVRRLSVDGLDLRLVPPGASTGGAAPRAPAEAPGASASAPLAIPELTIARGRIVQQSPDGVTRLEGVRLAGRFEARGRALSFTGDGAADEVRNTPARGGGETHLFGLTVALRYQAEGTTGELSGSARSDSLALVLPVAGGKPPARLRWPGPSTTFQVSLDLATPPSARTHLDGRVGPIPFAGDIDSRQAPGAPKWTSSGTLTLAAVPLDSLKALLPPEALAPLRQYALGGRLDGGTLTFATRAASDSLDYTLQTRLVDITAALPDKGRVIDDGQLDLTADGLGLKFQGRFASAGSRLEVDGAAGPGERAPWQAHLTVKGPAAEALRFLPPGGAPQVTAGALDLDVRLSGRVGDAGLPAAAGRLELRGVAGSHPALAVPIAALDLRTSFTGDRAIIESGQLRAGRSGARFQGSIQNFAKPTARIDVEAQDVFLDELFPEPVRGGAPSAGKSAGTATGAPPSAIPVSGRLTIARFVRQKMTLTDLTADYDVTAGGMRMKNLAATAWGGRVTGDLTLTPTGPEALDYSGQFEVSDARLADMLGAVSRIQGLDGRIQTQMTLSGKNGPAVNPLQTLTLDARALVIEGALLNIPALRKVAEALSFQNVATESFPFKALKSRFRVTNGFVGLDSCTVSQVGADWTLGGRVGLDGTLDIPITARLSTGLFQPGSELRRVAELLAGPEGRIPIGLKLSGTLTSPAVSVDVDPLLRQAKEKAKGAAADELKKRIGGLFKKP